MRHKLHIDSMGWTGSTVAGGVDADVVAVNLFDIDNEIAEADCGSIRSHLDECFPCLEKYGLEQSVKELVHRACGCDEVPADLRTKVLARIQQVRIQVESVMLMPPP